MSGPVAERAAALEPILRDLAAQPSPFLERAQSLLEERRELAVGGLWGASQSLFLALLARRHPGPWLVVAASEAEAELFAGDLEQWGLACAWLPARDAASGAGVDVELVRRRLEIVQRVVGPPGQRPRCIVTSLLSLLQPVPTASELERDFLTLEVGARLDPEALIERLVRAGFTRTPLAERPGEVSLRGEILDLYPLASELPLRVETFDEEVESLRWFDPLDQRSVARLERVELCLAQDAGDVEDGSGALPLSLASPTAVIVRVEPLRLEDRAGGLRIRSSAHARALDDLARRSAAHRRLDLQSLPARALTLDVRSVQSLAVGPRAAAAELSQVARSGARAVVLCRNEAEEHRFQTLLAEAGAEQVATCVGELSRGFRWPELGLVCVGHGELLGIAGRRSVARAQPAHRVRAIQSFFELKIGDLVVHPVHGLARFVGLVRLERAGAEEEHLHLLFADEVSLYVPASRIDLVQRYVGSGTVAPALDRIGGQSFRRRREKVERALRDLAAELLEVQARRSLKQRPPWPADEELVRELALSFPFTDTADQVTIDGELRADLTGEHPMDRLLCGDVGFGKTELAVRAAFRVVSGGAQVAVLVPTTVLAQQHYETFRARLADFPVQVGLLSRTVTGAREREALAGLEQGTLDVVVGTHRLLSQDVRFKRLGLAIVDEEQRFGVAHKEHFKRLRAEIDLLTLTATPIPRTLHMSLSGVRDISALTIAPEGRQEIETRLGYCEDDDLVREALLREKNRGGQVFFLHNRVESIEQVALRLQRLVPECSYAVGHGQMGARTLQRVMDLFTRGEVDVLVATTIIESGIDIPAAGTIVVDRADHFGLSELHQLRGRVGRGPHKAHCYLLVEQSKPLSGEARERLKALEEMNQLGAGFSISMKDLEIRGAGNILGPEQSGHIGAVGYDLYCRLLKRAVDSLQAGEREPAAREATAGEPGAELELGLPAFLPEAWIPDARTRLELLRHLSTIAEPGDAEGALAMLSDRFGRVPEEARNLVRVFRLKARLERAGIRRLAWRGEVYVLEFADRVALERELDLGRVELRPIRTGLAHLVVPERLRRASAALDWFERLLKHESEVPTIAPSPAAR